MKEKRFTATLDRKRFKRLRAYLAERELTGRAWLESEIEILPAYLIRENSTIRAKGKI